jgi:hypothetical protein
MLYKYLTSSAALVAALAVTAPAAHGAALCGCTRARQVARKSIRQAFPETLRVHGQRWRAFDSGSTRSRFHITYGHGRAAVGLQVSYR